MGHLSGRQKLEEKPSTSLDLPSEQNILQLRFDLITPIPRISKALQTAQILFFFIHFFIFFFFCCLHLLKDFLQISVLHTASRIVLGLSKCQCCCSIPVTLFQAVRLLWGPGWRQHSRCPGRLYWWGLWTDWPDRRGLHHRWSQAKPPLWACVEGAQPGRPHQLLHQSKQHCLWGPGLMGIGILGCCLSYPVGDI